MRTISIEGVSPALQVTAEGAIARVTLTRPEVLNALNHEQRANLEHALKALDADADVRVVVLAGAGRAFCAGQDQRESATMDAHGAARRIEGYASLYRVMRSLSKPLIARIQGYATGAGLQLALLCDLRIAGPSAKLGMTELNVGSAAIMGSAFLVSVIGEAAMRKLVLLSEFIDAGEARAINLVHEVFADDAAMDARIAKIAEGLAGRPPLGIALSKEWWRVMGDAQFEAAMEHARGAHARNYAAGGLSSAAKKFVEGSRS